ncbi:hypothetical protein BV898_07672 [Hypsibius exemplaris]|uniref:RNA polymerase III subunit Rpc25 domain-containing protein n=1 Tax=Hypsibius exemplaris TaxID=2072580 RepID=A0A1W0WSU9_HYPEX|nr:hypothetical protein BV898_07672 [Hypsibius exemplaris]
MFRSFELDKMLYVHPTFLGCWYRDAYSTARHLLQAQLVGHVLKDIGLVVIIVRVKNIIPGNFDPSDGGVFARVRFICYAFSPALNSILKGKVDSIHPDRLTVSCLGLPVVTIPRTLFPAETVYHPEKKSFVWAKKAPLYFEIKQDDEVKFTVAELTYDSGRPIALLDIRTDQPKTEAAAMTVVGDIHSTSMGPTHWWSTNASKSPQSPSLQDSVALLNQNEIDFISFMQKLRVQSRC